MANTIPARAPHTRSLREYLATTTGMPVGDGKAPAAGGWQGAPGASQFVNYLVVHSTPGGLLDGPLGDPHADAEFVWQIDACSATQYGAEIAGDNARAALLVQGLPPLNVAGRAIRWIREDIPAGGAREDPDQPSIWRLWAMYRIATTPTS